MPKDALPPHLRDRLHEDWPWPFSLIPRHWTAWKWGKPMMVIGNQKEKRAGCAAPIGEPGSWQGSIYPDATGIGKYVGFYLAFTTKRGIHFRIGARYDDVDSYVQWPSIAIKRGIK